MYVVAPTFTPLNQLIPCLGTSLDEVTGLPTSSFPMPIHEYSALRDGPVVAGWYDRMKSMMDNGIVHRFLDDKWKPGVMVKKGTKWVFKERSREELFKDFGIPVVY
jgi:hypothetical protein